jgi:hypothetical protein
VRPIATAPCLLLCLSAVALAAPQRPLRLVKTIKLDGVEGRSQSSMRRPVTGAVASSCRLIRRPFSWRAAARESS